MKDKVVRLEGLRLEYGSVTRRGTGELSLLAGGGGGGSGRPLSETPFGMSASSSLKLPCEAESFANPIALADIN